MDWRDAEPGPDEPKNRVSKWPGVLNRLLGEMLERYAAEGTVDFVMIPRRIFEALSSDAAFRVARHGAESSNPDYAGGPGNASDLKDFYNAVCYLRDAYD